MEITPNAIYKIRCHQLKGEIQQQTSLLNRNKFLVQAGVDVSAFLERSVPQEIVRTPVYYEGANWEPIAEYLSSESG